MACILLGSCKWCREIGYLDWETRLCEECQFEFESQFEYEDEDITT